MDVASFATAYVLVTLVGSLSVKLTGRSAFVVTLTGKVMRIHNIHGTTEDPSQRRR